MNNIITIGEIRNTSDDLLDAKEYLDKDFVVYISNVDPGTIDPEEFRTAVNKEILRITGKTPFHVIRTMELIMNLGKRNNRVKESLKQLAYENAKYIATL